MNIEKIKISNTTLYSLCDFAIELGWRTKAAGKVYPHQSRIRTAANKAGITPTVIGERHYITKEEMLTLMEQSQSENVLRIKEWLGEVNTFTEPFTIFTNEEFGKIRTTVINGEPYFVGTDVASLLGYKRPNDSIVDNVNAADILRDTIIPRSSQKPLLINESGVYQLILRSNLPSAVKFQHWITSEVLPAIRKTGGYVQKPEMFIKEYFSYLPNDLQQSLVIAIQKKNEELQAELTKAKEDVQKLSTENDVLSYQELSWIDRSVLNAGVRNLAKKCFSNDYGKVWNQLYYNLKYKHSIDLYSRAKRSGQNKIDTIKPDEWKYLLSTFAALCRDYHTTIEEMIPNGKYCVQ